MGRGLVPGHHRRCLHPSTRESTGLTPRERPLLHAEARKARISRGLVERREEGGLGGLRAAVAELRQRCLDSHTFSNRRPGTLQQNGLLGIRPRCHPGETAMTGAGCLAFPRTLMTGKFFVRACFHAFSGILGGQEGVSRARARIPQTTILASIRVTTFGQS